MEQGDKTVNYDECVNDYIGFHGCQVSLESIKMLKRYLCLVIILKRNRQNKQG